MLEVDTMRIETELKLSFSAQEFEQIVERMLEQGDVIERIIQTNHFFDSPTLQALTRGGMLRIRQIVGATTQPSIIAFKHALDKGQAVEDTIKQGVQSVQEYEADLVLSVADGVLSGTSIMDVDCEPVQQARQLFQEWEVDLSGITQWGTLKTARTVVRCGEWVFELDASTLGTGVPSDYELECEVPDVSSAAVAQRWLEAEVLGPLGISVNPSRFPKVVRLAIALGHWTLDADGSLRSTV